MKMVVKVSQYTDYCNEIKDTTYIPFDNILYYKVRQYLSENRDKVIRTEYLFKVKGDNFEYLGNEKSYNEYMEYFACRS